MNHVQPCVLVYNPLAGHGHLDSWNAMFISLLLAGGYRVLALTPDVAALRQRLELTGAGQSPNLQVLDWDVLRRNVAQRVVGRLGRMVAGLGARPAAPETASKDDPELHYLEPLEFAQRVREAVKKVAWKPHLILNMYMDLYRTDGPRWQAFDREHTQQAPARKLSGVHAGAPAGPIPWVGLRFIPWATPGEGYYQTTSLSGMCFLDQAVVATYQAQLPEKQFFYLPDITHADLPQSPNALALEIRRQAQGRTIVFMGGTIGATKNLAKWLALILRADPTRWFFVQIGEVHQAALNAEDHAADEQITRSPPANLFVKTGYLPDERTFNAIIQASDILFAVYRDFTISSNMLGKAAAFEKPILVADNHLMGDRVRHYGIGKAVPQDDVGLMLSALTDLTNETATRGGFGAYRDDFSQDALRTHLFNMMARCGVRLHSGK